jgi:hypothetical protein
MTLATDIYYSGYHPYTLKPVFTAKTPEQKKEQHLFFFWYKAENHQKIQHVLKRLKREDLASGLLPQKNYFNKVKPGNLKNKTR